MVFHCSANCLIVRASDPVCPRKDHSLLDKRNQNDRNSAPRVLEVNLKDEIWLIWGSWLSETKMKTCGAKRNDQNSSTDADERPASCIPLLYFISARCIFLIRHRFQYLSLIAIFKSQWIKEKCLYWVEIISQMVSFWAIQFLAEFHVVFHSGRKLVNSNWLNFALKWRI